ncbi:MAG: hypothetical protein P4L49_08285 [Desulfosporosinus sp.]|nr:hypothetical protein [Desulfosporosinus sp.]
MKKTILVSLAISATMLLSTPAAFAAQHDDAQTCPVGTAVAVATPASLNFNMPTEISGVVKEISQNIMTVETEDAKTYLVPLKQFAKIDGFSDLELQTGSQVSLKREDLTGEGNPQNIIIGTLTVVKSDVDLKAIGGTTTQDGSNEGLSAMAAGESSPQNTIVGTLTEVKSAANLKEIDGINLTTCSGNEALSINAGEMIFIATEISADGKTVNLPK